MRPPVRLSSEEIEALETVIATLIGRLDKPVTLDGLLHKWQAFVAEVERGYCDSIYEYSNDLSVRDILDEVLVKAPESLRRKVRSFLQMWDDRFNEATREIRKPLAPGVVTGSPRWWFRIPKVLTQELERDLRAAGVLE